MDKSLLIIDTPKKGCRDCDLCDIYVWNDSVGKVARIECKILGDFKYKYEQGIKINTRLPQCPLQPNKLNAISKVLEDKNLHAYSKVKQIEKIMEELK